MSLDQYLLDHYGTKRNVELVEDLKKLGIETTTDAIRNRWYLLNKGGLMPRKKPSAKVEDTLERDRKLDKLTQSERVTKKKYEEARQLIEKAERERDTVVEIQNFSTFAIKPKLTSGKSESTAIVLASDWHVEENVERAAVSDLNEYNLTVARKRATEFFQGTLRLVEIFQKDTRIDTLVLALLGDFISGNIHEDIAENNNLGATKALIFAEELLCSGIDFLLENSNLNLVIPCHSGNHGRTTKDQRMATENENSFEYYMYHVIARRYSGNKRVKFLISESYISYLPVYNYTIRFHHGHGMRYGGGVGGLFIPTYKAIARWNDGRRADIDCFGHFHQFRDGGTFVANGSMIGYNAYAISRGLSFERAQQVMFVIERDRGRTFTVPITFKS